MSSARRHFGHTAPGRDASVADQFAPLFPSDTTTTIRVFPSTVLRRRWLEREVQRAVAGKRASGLLFVVQRIALEYARQRPPLPWQAVRADLRDVEAFLKREIVRVAAGGAR